MVPLRAVRLHAMALAAACLLAAPRASADVSSWLAVGGGGAVERNNPASTHTFVPSMTYSMGVGSTPLAPVVVGGMVRGSTLFSLGTDLSLAIRAATGGFARGDWGVALDAGVLWRPWDSNYGEWPLQGVLTLGSPWGFQIAGGTELWTIDHGTPAQGFFAALELDFLRLTVMRQGGSERWWPNANPAGGHKVAFVW